jgi:hypothetical protein
MGSPRESRSCLFRVGMRKRVHRYGVEPSLLEVVPTVVHSDRSAFVLVAIGSVRVVIVRLERRAPDS